MPSESRHGLKVWFRSRQPRSKSLAQRSRYSVKDAAASPQIHEVACLPLQVAGRPQRHSGPPPRTLPHQPVPRTLYSARTLILLWDRAHVILARLAAPHSRYSPSLVKITSTYYIWHTRGVGVKQIIGIPMGSPVSPALAQIVCTLRIRVITPSKG